jgi:NAD(P)-dependent dehydrogenase (short-subunit alcohol dehydrogenase family)
MGKLDGKVAVIIGATSGMALASAKLFVEEGAYVFITGRRQESLDNAVKAIGRNVTGVQADSGKLADLDRLYETVKREKGYVVVFRIIWRTVSELFGVVLGFRCSMGQTGSRADATALHPRNQTLTLRTEHLSLLANGSSPFRVVRLD